MCVYLPATGSLSLIYHILLRCTVGKGVVVVEGMLSNNLLCSINSHLLGGHLRRRRHHPFPITFLFAPFPNFFRLDRAFSFLNCCRLRWLLALLWLLFSPLLFLESLSLLLLWWWWWCCTGMGSLCGFHIVVQCCHHRCCHHDGCCYPATGR